MPEEGTDEMLFRSDAYDFPALMGELFDNFHGVCLRSKLNVF